MNETHNLTMDTVLTVKEAAALTNRTVQSFYSEKRRADFGFDKSAGGKWRIPVSLLVEHGFLTADFQPTKKPFRSTAPSPEPIDRSEIERLELIVSELEKQRDTLEMLVHSQRRQIEMLEERLADK